MLREVLSLVTTIRDELRPENERLADPIGAGRAIERASSAAQRARELLIELGA